MGFEDERALDLSKVLPYPALVSPPRDIRKAKCETLHEFACHPYVGAMQVFSVSFQFSYMCCQSERCSRLLSPWLSTH